MLVRPSGLRSIIRPCRMLLEGLRMLGILLLVQRVACVSPTIVTQTWEKATEEAFISELLQLAEINLIRGLVMTKEVYSILEGFNGKLSKEETKSKKLSKDLKAMSLEKAQMESDKRFFQVR
ncbi:hypothetical protein Adt_03633 [Abeliophyllum distichum]|uniref:Uncharacterized protein n=1 Tax=Abeliophyllum distichum TaxID=126358 RepID=A0ABD1VZ07_9LAMI